MRQKSIIRRLQIIENARALVADRGMEGLTIKILARAVGVTEGAIYRHFRSKHEILLGLIDDIDTRLRERLERDETSEETPLETLESVFRSRLSAAERRLGVLSIVMAEVLLSDDDQLRQRMMEVIEGYLARVEAVLGDGVRMGEVNPDMPLRSAALLFFGLVQGVNTIRHFDIEELTQDEQHSLWMVYTRGIMKSRIIPPNKLVNEFRP